MELGICTRYMRHEAAFAALRVADFVNGYGGDVSIYTPTARPSLLDPRRDAKCCRSSEVSFTRWAARQTHILWTHIPHIEQLQWAKQQRIRTSILVLWHELIPAHRAVLAAADHVICPSSACLELLRRVGLRNCVYVPWDGGQPLHRKPAAYRIACPRVLLPLWDGGPRRTEMTLVDVVGRTLRQQPACEITLACNTSVLRAAAMRRFMGLTRMFPGRFTVCRNVHPWERFKLFQAHDLTLYPSHGENTGLTAIQSVELGTPVLGFHFRPLYEVVLPPHSVGVHCREEIGSCGVPFAIPNYDSLEQSLHQLLQDTDYLRELQRMTLPAANWRRTEFTKSLLSVLQ